MQNAADLGYWHRLGHHIHAKRFAPGMVGAALPFFAANVSGKFFKSGANLTSLMTFVGLRMPVLPSFRSFRNFLPPLQG